MVSVQHAEGLKHIAQIVSVKRVRIKLSRGTTAAIHNIGEQRAQGKTVRQEHVIHQHRTSWSKDRVQVLSHEVIDLLQGARWLDVERATVLEIRLG